MKTLVINADDYGFDRNRTEAIRECFRRKLVSQTTAMVNMPYCEQAIIDATSDGIADRIGLHLNLTFGPPLTKAIQDCPRFCNKDGRFSGAFHRSRTARILLSATEKDVVRKEIRAQMERYLSFRLPLMHLDSHHHAHTDPTILRIVLPLAREMGFKSVRISRNAPASPSLFKRLYKSYVNRMMRQSGLLLADRFASADSLIDGKWQLKDNKVAEVMIHPLFVHGERMPLDMEYDFTDGVLCDTFSPIDNLASGLVRLLDGTMRMACYAEVAKTSRPDSDTIPAP